MRQALVGNGSTLETEKRQVVKLFKRDEILVADRRTRQCDGKCMSPLARFDVAMDPPDGVNRIQFRLGRGSLFAADVGQGQRNQKEQAGKYGKFSHANRSSGCQVKPAQPLNRAIAKETESQSSAILPRQTRGGAV